MKIISTVFLGAGLLAASLTANSATLSLVPDQTNLPVNSFLQMNLIISGLGNHTAPSLAAFDVDISYDSSLLSLVKYSYGGSLGDYDLGEALTISDTTGSNTINLSELSLLEANSNNCIFCVAPYLEDLQGESFGLAHLMFKTTASGTAAFGLTINSMADGNGDALPAAINSSPAVTVAPVPLPSAIWLFMSSFSVFGLFFRQRHG